MKKFVTMLLAAAAVFAGCNGGDNADLQSQIDDLDARLTSVENAVSQLKNDFNSLQILVQGLQDKVYISNITDTPQGWDLLMTNGRTLSIINGEGGSGDALGTRKDPDDGKYYWTLNGNYLLVEGNKVPVYSETYVNPEFKIEDNKLYVKFAGETDFTLIGEVGSSVAPAVTNVEEVGGNVVITLAAGETIVVPKIAQLALSVSGPSTMEAGATETFAYSVTGSDASTQVVALAQGNWKAVVNASSASAGSIDVTAPAVWEDGRIVVLASNASLVVMKVIEVSEGTPAPSISITDNVLNVPAAGGTFNIPVVANFQPEFSGNPAWITVAEVKAVYNFSFTVAANDGAQRSATVTFRNADGSATAAVEVSQEAKSTVAAQWYKVSQWEIQSATRKTYYNNAWKENSPNYGTMPSDTAGVITFDHSGSLSAGTTSNNANKLDVPTSSSAFKVHDPRAYGTWEGDSWTLESLYGAEAGQKAKVYFEIAGSQTSMGFWKMEYLDGTEWKLAATAKTVSFNGADVVYTHRLYDRYDEVHSVNGAEEPGFIPFASDEVTFSAATAKITFRMTAVTTIQTDGVTISKSVADGGDGAGGWIELVASMTATYHFPQIWLYK